MKVRVISLWQPWAALIVSGAKKIETRSWYPRELRPGERIAIHASKRWTEDERELCQDDPFFKRHLTLAARRGLWDFDQPPLGCIVGTAVYQGVRRTERAVGPWMAEAERVERGLWLLTDTERAFGNYVHGRYGWLLSDPQPINPPVPLRGHQGIFTWDMSEGAA